MQAPETHYVSRGAWLRASVLGANDGLISTASLVVGVAAAASGRGEILTAAFAGWAAGAMSIFNMRREYLQAVAEALAQYPQAEIGVGTVHQVARAVQRSFVLEAPRETSVGASGSRHSRPPRSEASAGR